MKLGNNIRQRRDGRYEARYIRGKDKDGKSIWGYSYGLTYDEAEAKRNIALGYLLPIRENNLLILGAGDHGQEVKELAEGLRVFRHIDFLDDNIKTPEIIGKVDNPEQYLQKYPLAIPAVGDNELRTKWMVALIKAGFVIPTLIHPNATVSNSAEIQAGTVICAGSTIGFNAKIGRGCIVDSGAIVEKNAVVPDWTRIDCGEIYRSNGRQDGNVTRDRD